MIFYSSIILIFKVLNWIKFYLTPWSIPVKNEFCQKSLFDRCTRMPVIRDHSLIMNLLYSWKVVILPVKQTLDEYIFFYRWLNGTPVLLSQGIHPWRLAIYTYDDMHVQHNNQNKTLMMLLMTILFFRFIWCMSELY